MPTLTFRIKKRPDASAVLVLVREDGSSTAGSIGPPNGYGPVHDLAHYVVERTLGLSEGFLGLVASGWEIADFERKGIAKQLPEITHSVIEGMRNELLEVRQRWNELAPRETLELSFASGLER